jgi:hypothetical protein
VSTLADNRHIVLITRFEPAYAAASRTPTLPCSRRRLVFSHKAPSHLVDTHCPEALQPRRGLLYSLVHPPMANSREVLQQSSAASCAWNIPPGMIHELPLDSYTKNNYTILSRRYYFTLILAHQPTLSHSINRLFSTKLLIFSSRLNE